MSNYRKEREIDREGEEGAKGRKYVIFPLFSPSFFALFAFAVKYFLGIQKEWIWAAAKVMRRQKLL
ncbi:MAG: hypothetical protein LBO80_00330 [Treponema sp.]|jgi:hypothetical protein|nr:hypothetical protein [Treponema sp.]